MCSFPGELTRGPAQESQAGPSEAAARGRQGSRGQRQVQGTHPGHGGRASADGARQARSRQVGHKITVWET